MLYVEIDLYKKKTKKKNKQKETGRLGADSALILELYLLTRTRLKKKNDVQSGSQRNRSH